MFPAPFLRRCIRITVPQPLFAELKECVPGMSDRLLSARLKEGI